MSVLITKEKASTQRKRIRLLLESGKEVTNRLIQQDMGIVGATARLSELRREFQREGKVLATRRESEGYLVYFLR
ncbi:helix-turn-helix domain-containing protein [Ignatzschineria rhizosphaerae]|uniref:Helix-turn-helix domain-containing protein n=1 Tax=Ignatzschineria rhizosphaerae TaxID=2923279 RepID=A0ABY3X203_9GAMM|nr:helix-turn-helix domain-containing protein [Ignatzschineria rhizosphaerae]UNM95920.1 helix-turn-helix domain-containing protein [Ignatzschineria rhizosphaerae]